MLLVCSIIGVASCVNNDGNNNSNSVNTNGNNEVTASSVNGEDAVQQTDTTKQEAKNVKPEGPKLSFATTEAALEYMKSSKDADKYAEGIIPHMATEDLSYATKLLNNTYQRFLIVDKELMRVGLFDKYGREILSYGIACARNFGTKHRKADSRTPEGFFSVEGVYNSTDWLFTDDNGYTSPARGQFGPRFIRIKIPVTSQIGIHGTAAPGSIGRRCSHGCIRVKNENILELVKYVEPGMPVIITPSKRDQQVNAKEGVHIAKVTMDPYGKYTAPAVSAPVKQNQTPANTSSKSKNQTEETATSVKEPQQGEAAEQVKEEVPAPEPSSSTTEQTNSNPE